MSDELTRLRAADPMPTPSHPVPPPLPEGRPGRGPRLRAALAAALGTLALGGLVGALIVAAPSDDEPGPPVAQPLEMSLLTSSALAPFAGVSPGVEIEEITEVGRAGGVVWYAGTRPDRPDLVCLLSFGADEVVRVNRCGPIADGLVAGARSEGARLRIAGLVPDGIDSVTIAGATIPVHDNAFTTTTRERPDVVILQGPSASRIPGRADVAVATRIGDPPAVAMSFEPIPPPELPAPPVPVGLTLEEAVAAVPFTVFVPEPPPLDGERWIQLNPSPPAAFPQLVIDYLPATTGTGIGLVEGPRRARVTRAGERTVSRDGLTIHVRDDADPTLRYIRTVIDGTHIQITGGADATLDELIDVAASLRPVAP